MPSASRFENSSAELSDPGPWLLSRPVPFDDERDTDYLERLASENGLVDPERRILTALRRAMEPALGYRLRGHDENELVCEDLGSYYGRHEIPWWAVKPRLQGAPAVCPKCLEQSRHIRAAWYLRGFDLCPVHGALLATPYIDRFTKAPVSVIVRGGQLAYRSNKILAEGDKVEIAELALAARIWGPITKKGSGLDTQIIAISIFWVKLLSEVVKARGHRDLEVGSFRPLARAVAWLKEYRMRFDPTVEGVAAFLGALPSTVHSVRAAALLERVILEEHVRPTVLSCLPLRAWQTACPSGGCVSLRPGGLAVLADEARTGGGVVVARLAQEFGVCPGRLRDAMNNAGVKPKVVVGWRRTHEVFDSEVVRRVLDSVNPHIGRWAALKLLGMQGQRQITRLFRRTQLISFWSAGSGAYNRAAIEGLLQSLKLVALPAQASDQSKIALASPALYRKMDHRAIHEMFDDLRARRVPLVFDGSLPGLQGFFIPLNTLARLRQRSLAFQHGRKACPMQLGLFDVDSTSSV